VIVKKSKPDPTGRDANESGEQEASSVEATSGCVGLEQGADQPLA